MAESGGAPVAGMMSSLMGPDGEADKPQYPTWWTVYLAVEDCAAATRAAVAAGGSIAVPTMEIAGLGAMAVVIDPSGAAVGLWEGRELGGFEFTGQPGSPVWFELMTTDFDAGAPFYQWVFGWQLAYMGEDSEPTEGAAANGIRYATNFPGEEASAGIREADFFLPEGVPSFGAPTSGWRIRMRRSRRSPGSVAPTRTARWIHPGRVATVEDPQGGMFQIVSVS
ncbi:VOC family protein [Corynebacterium suedekumii]|nr:VOC family protein [Corynebacterium suedekumii]